MLHSADEAKAGEVIDRLKAARIMREPNIIPIKRFILILPNDLPSRVAFSRG